MKSQHSKFNSPEELIEDIRNGKMVILVDDEDRENEGDIVLAADHVTPALINFMAKEARGLICLSLSSEQVERLQLPQMVREDSNFSPNKTAFTVSIEASSGVSTGISAADRAHTVRVASRPEAKPTDIHIPGHIFPIRAQQGGVLRRAGHTEGSVDLSRLAGLNPAAVICEVMKEDGSMARVPDLLDFAKKHSLKIGTIVDLIEYRLSRDLLIEEVLDVELPEQFLGLRARIFKSKIDGQEHLVLQKGELDSSQPTLVRMHLDSFTKDLFSLIKQKESALELALHQINKEESGVFVLLRGNNKSQGLVTEIKTLMGEQAPSEMDSRDYGIGAQILRSIGVHQIKLLSNKHDKLVGLKAFGIEIVEVIPLQTTENEGKNVSQDRRRHFTV
jgi:3,4-dihydroxy 2-butanone 4-phosphate synthase/GTP cyclohydrolase II